MHVFLTGATGTIGSAILAVLLRHGHDVTAGVRDEAKAAAIDDAGGTGVVVDYADRARLVYLMRESDGVIQAAGSTADPEGFDLGVAEAAIEALSGSAKPYVHTGGIWTYGAGDSIEETDPFDPPAAAAWRPTVIERLERADLPLTVIHPAIVYGSGDDIPDVVLGGPRDAEGRIVLVGDGAQHWTTIHVDDLAELYVAALEAGSGFDDVIGASGDNPTVAEIVAAANPAGGAAESPEASRERLGADFADALLLDQAARGDKARGIGGWVPTRPSLVDALRAGRS